MDSFLYHGSVFMCWCWFGTIRAIEIVVIFVALAGIAVLILIDYVLD